jgi:hypothetical protein
MLNMLQYNIYEANIEPAGASAFSATGLFERG